MDPIIEVECIDTLDPKIVRVTFRSPIDNSILWTLDVPTVLYPVLFPPFGFPPNPCS